MTVIVKDTHYTKTYRLKRAGLRMHTYIVRVVRGRSNIILKIINTNKDQDKKNSSSINLKYNFCNKKNAKEKCKKPQRMNFKQQPSRPEAFWFWQHVKAHIMKVSSQNKTTEILGVALTPMCRERN